MRRKAVAGYQGYFCGRSKSVDVVRVVCFPGVGRRFVICLTVCHSLKAEVKIIPVVISRTSTFHVKTLAGIDQLVSFKEEPQYELTFKQLPLTAKRIAIALHVHAQEWLSHISKTSRKSSSKKKGHKI